MTMHDKPRIARRSYLRGAGVTLATLGGMTGSVVAKGKGKGKGGGVQPLSDRGADILVFWSQADADADDPDQPRDFGFPNPGLFNEPPGGVMFGGHDPAGGGLFDFSRIRMMPNGNLQNKWVLFGRAVMKTGPKPYFLVPTGPPGMYRSRGQEMTFKARTADEILAILKKAGLNLPGLPPALRKLAGGKWHAIGSEVAQLGIDEQGNPDPTKPEWAATRIDFRERKSGDYGLSLLYVLGADDEGTPNPENGIPPAALASAQQLILGGRLNPGGR